MEYELINLSFNISMTTTGGFSDDHDLDKLGRLVNLLAPAPIRVGQCGLGCDCVQLMWVESQIGRRPIIKRQTSAQHWASHITGRREETGLDVIR